jgi:hypothetical protein
MSSRYYASAAKRALKTIQKGEQAERKRAILGALEAKAINSVAYPNDPRFTLNEEEVKELARLRKLYKGENDEYLDGGAKKISLDKLTVKELQKKCSVKGIKYSGLKKDELVKALRK